VKSVIKIGRSSTSDLRVAHPAVSARHAELRKENGTYNLVDLSSSNGTFVNGERISSKLLSEGDLVNFGPAAFIFHDEKLQLRSDLDEKEKPSNAPFDSVRKNRTGLLALLVIVLLVVVGIQMFSSEDEEQIASVVDESVAIPPAVGEKTAVDIVTETFLLADYPWGVYNERTSRLQALLGMPPDGIYDLATRVAHIAALQGRGMTIETVPEVPITTTSTTTTPPTTTTPTAIDWNELTRSIVYLEAGDFDCQWAGSGTLVLNGEYVLTNAHVLGEKWNRCDLLYIYAADSPVSNPRWIADGKVIPEATDENIDLAVIKLVDTKGNPKRISDRKSINIETVDLNLGDQVTVIGYPGSGGDRITLSSGEHSGWWSESLYSDDDFYKSSAKSGPGVSGGAAFNSSTGQFIGIPSGGTVADIGDEFTLIRPSSYAVDLLKLAKKYG